MACDTCKQRRRDVEYWELTEKLRESKKFWEKAAKTLWAGGRRVEYHEGRIDSLDYAIDTINSLT